jgi:hypothetical protein
VGDVPVCKAMNVFLVGSEVWDAMPSNDDTTFGYDQTFLYWIMDR